MNKVYAYKGEIYSDSDLSNEISNYGGDLYSLYFELKRDRRAYEHTFYSTDSFENTYDEVSDLIENEFDDLEVNESEVDKFYVKL